MATNPVTFEEGGARRIVDATRWVEGQRDLPQESLEFRNVGATDEELMELVVVRQKEPDGQGRTIEVTPVILTEDGEFADYAFEAVDGVPTRKVIMCWPNTQAHHYAAIAQPDGDLLSSHAVVTMAVRMWGFWYCMQLNRWHYPLQDERFDIRGCLPVNRSPG